MRAHEELEKKSDFKREEEGIQSGSAAQMQGRVSCSRRRWYGNIFLRRDLLASGEKKRGKKKSD